MGRLLVPLWTGDTQMYAGIGETGPLLGAEHTSVKPIVSQVKERQDCLR